MYLVFYFLLFPQGIEHPEGKPFKWVLHKAVFDLTFFVLFSTIGLNIVFGIIVDTFAELRDSKVCARAKRITKLVL